MKIGIVGAGNMGFGMGRLWAENGHEVCFSYSRSPAKLAATVAAAGINATLCTPIGAASFGQVILLAVHWPQVSQVLGEIRPYLAGKPLLTCILPRNALHNNLSVGTGRSAAEKIARLVPRASVVEALPLLADTLYAPSRLFGSEAATLFYCGNNEAAKEMVVPLLAELDMQPVDAGDLTSARYLEPATALLMRLAREQGAGTEIALKLLER
jgi:predicted dinucleotide-binding enzyme